MQRNHFADCRGSSAVRRVGKYQVSKSGQTLSTRHTSSLCSAFSYGCSSLRSILLITAFLFLGKQRARYNSLRRAHCFKSDNCYRSVYRLNHCALKQQQRSLPEHTKLYFDRQRNRIMWINLLKRLVYCVKTRKQPAYFSDVANESSRKLMPWTVEQQSSSRNWWAALCTSAVSSPRSCWTIRVRYTTLPGLPTIQRVKDAFEICKISGQFWCMK